MKSPIDAIRERARAVIHRCPECSRPVFVDLDQRAQMTLADWLPALVALAAGMALGVAIGTVL